MLQAVAGRFAELFSLPVVAGSTAAFIGLYVTIRVTAKGRSVRLWPPSELWFALAILWWLIATNGANIEYRPLDRGEPFLVSLAASMVVAVSLPALVLALRIAVAKLGNRKGTSSGS